MAIPLGRYILGLDGSALPAREQIGGKAWSVARMQSLGLPVPPAFVITTDACRAYLEVGQVPDDLAGELDQAIAWLEAQTGRTLGRGPQPLLVAVRSGAAISMPGMMDTVLNLGINADTAAALAAEAGDVGFATDTHRRFLELYASIVLKLTLDTSHTATPAELLAVIDAQGGTVPATAREQLQAAVEAVFASWNSRRAKKYRKHHAIPDSLGTAVTVQAMVFGNLDDRSGTGVLFSRNPLTGDPEPYGEYLHRAQGEDVVSGKFTPESLSVLAQAQPDIHAELMRAAATLEAENGDVQDIEFTVQQGRLYLLQSRSAKRAPQAAVRFAVDMVEEGRIEPATALARVSAEQVRTLLKPRLANGAADGVEVLARGEVACQGVGVGVVVTDSDEAERRHAAGEAVVLARDHQPEDVHGMIAAVAVITEQGGSTSHAAVVSRALGVPAWSVAARRRDHLAGRTVTVDANAGLVYGSALAVETPDETPIRGSPAWRPGPRPQPARSGEPGRRGRRGGARSRSSRAEDPARLPAARGHAVVRGLAVESDAGVAAALAAA